MKPTKSISILLSLFLISNCGDKVREEITDRYDNGSKKLLVRYKGEGSDEVVVERITYGSRGDTLYWEKPLEDFYYEKIIEEITEKDGKKLFERYSGEGKDKIIIERITYGNKGDTLRWEKPLEDFYYGEGIIESRDGKKEIIRYIGESNDIFLTMELMIEKSESIDIIPKELVMLRYYYPNEKLKGVINFKDGKKNGKEIHFYENGQIELEVNYKNGKEDGKLTEYFENGQLRFVVNFTDESYTDGKEIHFYENGQIKGEKYFKDGKEDGKGTFYYENGQIEVEGNYKGGGKDGKWTNYYENGQISWVGYYKDGKVDGKTTIYNDDGSIYIIEEYKDGELVE